MPSARQGPAARLGGFFAVDDEWERPRPAIGRADVLVAAGMEGFALLTFELSRSAGGVFDPGAPLAVKYLAVTSGAVVLVGRRRFPLSVAVFAALHMFVVGVTMPSVMAQVALQASYFVAFFGAMAWAASRRRALAAMSAITLFMLLWITWQFAVGNAIQRYLDDTTVHQSTGIFPAIPSTVIVTFLINIVYFVGAIIGGQVSWLGARRRAALVDQAATIAEQSESLRRNAVVEERMRIARELHDVVAHHVSVIGIQAAASRRVLDRDPRAAKEALGEIEASSRDAVTQMRGLLGTLRVVDEPELGEVGDDPVAGPRHRAPEPGLSALPDLVAVHGSGPVATAYDLVEDPAGALERLPAALGLSLYRTVQEALANVSRHSTATEVRVVARVVEREIGGYAEVEVIDNGRPRPWTSGTGLGQLGIRERVASHRGQAEIGPRATGGYRVRVRLPLGDRTAAAPGSAPGLARAGRES